MSFEFGLRRRHSEFRGAGGAKRRRNRARRAPRNVKGVRSGEKIKTGSF
jgi:hypothetical protein